MNTFKVSSISIPFPLLFSSLSLFSSTPLPLLNLFLYCLLNTSSPIDLFPPPPLPRSIHFASFYPSLCICSLLPFSSLSVFLPFFSFPLREYTNIDLYYFFIIAQINMNINNCAVPFQLSAC